MQHQAVLEKIQQDYERDQNVLGMLVFGSVAKGTHHQNSDIDLSIVYQSIEPGYSFSSEIVDGIKVGFSRWSSANLHMKVEEAPYRLHVFAYAKLLFDRADISHLQEGLKQYFVAHPEIDETWSRLNESYEAEKEQFGEGKTSIFEVYHNLDRRFGPHA